MNRAVVHKVAVPQNPTGLLRKYLELWEIEVRLNLMAMSATWSPEFKKEDEDDLASEAFLVGLPSHRLD